jgi:hypothetical protein
VATINTSKSGLQNLLTALLAPANQDQNFFLPPWIFSSFVNTVTSFLLDKCAALYPDNPVLLDIVSPFVKIACIPPSGGLITLPKDYRNILGAPSIIVNKAGECGEVTVPITTPQQFLTATLKGGCNRRPITIVAQSEFDYLTTSSYKAPTYWNPIGYFTGQNEDGQTQIRVCPAQLTKVYVMYIQQEQIYNYAYIQNPDDSFYFDSVNSTDTIWGNAAYSSLLKGLIHLYGIYSRDKQFTDWAQSLSQISIV